MSSTHELCNLLLEVDITKLLYSPEEGAGANCLEEWEKAELIASPLVETPRFLDFFNFNDT